MRLEPAPPLLRNTVESWYDPTDSSRVMNIDSTDKQTLESISTSDLGQISAFARNLLIASGATNYLEPIFLPEPGLKSSKRDKYRGMNTFFEENLLKVYPNPANTFITVQYNLKDPLNYCCVEITDIIGKTICRIPLSLKQDQKIISVNDLNQGVYVVTLKNNGKSVKKAKVTRIW